MYYAIARHLYLAGKFNNFSHLLNLIPKKFFMEDLGITLKRLNALIRQRYWSVEKAYSLANLFEIPRLEMAKMIMDEHKEGA